jgi:hypothetical protein
MRTLAKIVEIYVEFYSTLLGRSSKISPFGQFEYLVIRAQLCDSFV